MVSLLARLVRRFVNVQVLRYPRGFSLGKDPKILMEYKPRNRPYVYSLLLSIHPARSALSRQYEHHHTDLRKFTGGQL